VRDGRRGSAVVAVAWVDMPDDAQAREFQRLVDRQGTGNLTELTREGAAPHRGAMDRRALRLGARRRDDRQRAGRAGRPHSTRRSAAELASTTTVG
jgi:hypothetical protein